MDTVIPSMVIVPGAVALLIFLLFSYLFEQRRQPYFRAWQVGWGAYVLHYAADAWNYYHQPSAILFFASLGLMVLMALCILVSTRLMRDRFRFRWYEIAIGVAGFALAAWNTRLHFVNGAFLPDSPLHTPVRLEIGLALILLYCSGHYYLYGHRRNSLAFQVLAFALALWAVLLGFGQFRNPFLDLLGDAGHFSLGPIPQMLLGIAMVMVMFENERNSVQENALAFSTLGIDSNRLLSVEELTPRMQGVLDRLVAPLPSSAAVLYIAERWRGVLPSVQRDFSPEFLASLERTGAGEYLSDFVFRRGGFYTFRNIPEMQEPLPASPGGRYEQFKLAMAAQNITDLTVVSLQTREHNFGFVLLPRAEHKTIGPSNLRLMIALCLQIGLTLENYAIMHDAQRRTREFELLTQIGQATSSHLDQDEILRTIQVELGRIFPTREFYIAFQEGDEIRFELEVENGQITPKRSRPVASGWTEYIVRTGQPLLIRSDLESTREKLGLTFRPPRPAKSFCAAPIFLGGKPAGVMAAMSYEREYVYEARDLEIMRTAAGQVSVAVENARLFADEQRRSKQLAFLNNISKVAISSGDAEQMLVEIVREIEKNFRFDHIGVGILDYATKDIEIKAEAGPNPGAIGRRFTLGSGILGRVARSGSTQRLHDPNGNLGGVLPQARSVLCIPISYGETLLGVLGIESLRDNAFTKEDELILNTLADLLATALHNSFVFQKLQQQSITDGLTGIKTRRFFWEALTGEWKRASRSGRPFSVVLIDLDKFKDVNDTLGHLEGDLVLARVGRLLEQKCRQSNVVARYGGDEFIILMPETGVEQSQVLAERLRVWIATDQMLAEHHITGSFGVASFPAHGFSVEDIIRVADAGMYVSKHAGGNRVSTAEELGESEGMMMQRQLIAGYIEGFLQREHAGPEHLEELVATLRKLSNNEDANSAQVLRDSIEALTRAAELRETNASKHGEQAGRYAELIDKALGMASAELNDLTFVARVHDVGKIFVPDRILNKAGALTEDEFRVVKTHAATGAEVVAALPNSDVFRAAVEHHHETFDGSGYPDGLRGEEIPLWSRILAVADAFANMTADRSFAPAKTSEQALQELEKMSGTRYDGMLVRILARQLKAEKASSFGPDR